MKEIIHIELVGTHSTTYNYIKHVIQKVIARAALSVDWSETTDLSTIISRNLHVVPTLVINGVPFPFPPRSHIHSSLRRAIIHILREQNYGQWPFFVLGCTSIEKDKNPFLFSYNIAKRFQAALECSCPPEVVFDSQKTKDNKTFKENDNWLDNIFSAPLVGYSYHYMDRVLLEQPPSYFKKAQAIILPKNEARSLCSTRSCLLAYCNENSLATFLIPSSESAFQLQSIRIVSDQESSVFYRQPFLQQIAESYQLLVEEIPLPSLHAVHVGAIPEDGYNNSSLLDEVLVLLEEQRPSSDLWCFCFSNQSIVEELYQHPIFIRWLSKDNSPILLFPL